MNASMDEVTTSAQILNGKTGEMQDQVKRFQLLEEKQEITSQPSFES